MPSSTQRNLRGKTVLITGASSGIGRSTALEFARSCPEALKLVLTARRVDRLEEVKQKIREEVGEGVSVLVKQLDVGRKEDVDRFWDGLEDAFRDVHVLVNNA